MFSWIVGKSAIICLFCCPMIKLLQRFSTTLEILSVEAIYQYVAKSMSWLLFTTFCWSFLVFFDNILNKMLHMYYSYPCYKLSCFFMLALYITETIIVVVKVLSWIMQFAMHYSWSTEARARRALANVSALLRPGGTFIGTMPDANVIIKKLREGWKLQLAFIFLVLQKML